ncbi:MAG: DNA-directed RNA polymerase subunit alpha [Planctomycetes bacterium]|nr:DNA-directed RNA polymerase subunit alpha [Planctomycetota bacterium]
MRIRWRGLELPTRVICEDETKTETYAKFIAEPFERGYGVTVGNSLRRVLLSSLEGAAVVSFRIEGTQHEFATIEGVVEDVTDIALNLKQLLVRVHSDQIKTLKVVANKRGEVTAKDAQCDAEVEVVNPDLHLLTLSQDVSFEMELEVRKGRGYMTAEENQREPEVPARIPLDSSFSPVRRVRYRTEDTRVGQRTNYDRLILEIWTDGTIAPDMALVEAGKILRKHLDPFVQYFELGHELQLGPDGEEESEEVEESSEGVAVLDLSITELEIPVRAQNCLTSMNIRTLRDLVAKTEEELLDLKNFGKASLDEVKRELEKRNLTLGMQA